MNARRKIFTILSLFVILSMVFGSALAEDGLLFRRNPSKTPGAETSQAGLYMMDFYVPAQASDGTVGVIANYQLADGSDATDYPDRAYAKPLVAVYNDGYGDIHYYEESATPHMIDGSMSFGAFDAFVAVSLDDGTTWKRTNLSQSADKSSFTLANGTAFPGDVHHMVHQVFNDNVLVAWASRYCAEGTPLYAQPLDSTWVADLEVTYGKDAIYLYDLFGVGGTQGSVDYTDQGYPEIGEVPFTCIWTARGKLIAGDDPATTETEATYFMWTKPERLTSGTRDANLPAVDCAAGAGCIVTWQEDPQGLRPGQGLGPGEGWSGAVAWQQTDVWYSHIAEWEFDMVFSAEDVVDGGIALAEYALLDGTMPKPYVPMAMPVRLTDNAMCKASGGDPYCYIDFDTIDDLDPTALPTSPETGADFCAETVQWINPGGTTLNLCETEDGRLLNGRVAATRVRLNLKPYTPAGAVDLDGDGVVESQAWVIMAAEETKALGTPVAEDEEEIDPVDIGKDMFYYSFDPFMTGVDVTMVQQGGMINQPAVCSEHDLEQGVTCTVGEFFPVQTDERGYEFYLTEIARRFSVTTNKVQVAAEIDSGLSAMLIFKQGVINQGGPADIFLRPVRVDDEFDPAVDNPYAFENIDCEEWAYTDGSNPNYLQGLCLSSAINISGTTIVSCTNATGNDACAATFPVNDDGSIPDSEADFPKMLEWRNCDGSGDIEGCEDDDDLDDQSWESPFDIAKGHRGFLDGDYVMIMYAWSPNWKANSVGNDHYNLYVRRSFDGGATWTTTPAALEGAGTTAIENYCVSTATADCVGTEFTYATGDFEQARNVSQLIGNKVTILDPRYSPTGGLKLYPTISTWFIDEYGLNTYADTLPYDDDLARDPSKFFMIYETGDNTTSEFGEATPLDLFYSRASVYGDVWELDPDYYDETTGELLEYRWNWAEHNQELLSGEASMLVNPGGTFMYSVWNQWEEYIYHDEFGVEHEEIFNSDMYYRRFMYLPDDTTAETLPVAVILSAPSAALQSDQLLTFAGGGYDADNPDGTDGVVAYAWYSNIDGLLGHDQLLSIRSDQLSVGTHIISLFVTDDEGVTSQAARTIVVIAGGAYYTNLPMLRK